VCTGVPAVIVAATVVLKYDDYEVPRDQ